MDPDLSRSDWLDRFTAWAEGREDIRAVVLVGSRGTRGQRAVESWSDIDLLIFTTRPVRLIHERDWMSEVGGFWAAVFPLQETFGGLLPVYCGFSAYEAGVAADFFIVSFSWARTLLPIIRLLNRYPGARNRLPGPLAWIGAPLGELVRNGSCILIDKEGKARPLIEAMRAIPIRPAQPPTRGEFRELVEDFWIGPPRMVAHLFRGRLMQAMKTLETGRRELLQLITWHARAGEGGYGEDNEFRPTLIMEWADPRWARMIPKFYPNLEPGSLWAALLSMLEIFPQLSLETAEALGDGQLPDHTAMVDWVRKCHRDFQQESQ